MLLEFAYAEALWDEVFRSWVTKSIEGTPTEVSDKLSFIAPNAVQRLVSQVFIHDLIRKNIDSFERLEKAGFKVNAFGDPYWHILERIKVKSDATLTHYTPSGLRFSDSTEIPADLAIFATGFDPNIQNIIREYFGKSVADENGRFSYMDDEGELEGAYKFNQAGLACIGGAIGPSRWFSRFVVLHMKAKLTGHPLVVYSKH
ncbi:hypothetical protein BU24DRAFT_465556 [Aaosphaeria arxii CBS 175.79]|uniref:FAD/NAD(P)-binding domain-containing protein n=1 Tax=Aaosphaeria arxii CBS 175.79 TaxID=1450172 RepID=A0A6A5XGD4_9PLEO|nr:uncharacterized protein BU24DRAFT_465556 [Aaosphaeria arxii CBS 175.79]KAF2011980.1 hypothetical protein BU24DRAFT_465556 [Aaosphaeria arxii CBS 175.79]